MKTPRWQIAVLALVLAVLSALSLRWSAAHPFPVFRDEAEYVKNVLRDRELLREEGWYRLAKAYLFEDAARPPAMRVLALPFALLAMPTAFALRFAPLVSMWIFAALVFAALLRLRDANTALAGTLATLAAPAILAAFTWFGTEYPLLIAMGLLFVVIGRGCRTSADMVVLAVALSIGTLSRSSFLPIAIGSVIVLSIMRGSSRARVLIASAAAAVVAGPWWWFNGANVPMYGTSAGAYLRHTGARVMARVELGLGVGVTIGIVAALLLMRRGIGDDARRVMTAACVAFAAAIAPLFFSSNANPRFLVPAILPLVLIAAVVTRAPFVLLAAAAIQLVAITPRHVYAKWEQWDLRPLRAYADADRIAFLGGSHQLHPSALRVAWLQQGDDVQVTELWRYERGPLDWARTMQAAAESDLVLTMPGYRGDPHDRQELDNAHNAEFAERLSRDSRFRSAGQLPGTPVAIFVRKETPADLFARDEEEVRAALAAVRDAGARAASITLYRIAQPFDADYQQIRKTAKQTIAGYPVLGQVSLSRDEAAPLVQLLGARETYFAPGQGWTCLFEPHHVLQLAADGKTVTIVICVECGDIQFFTGGGKAAAMKSVVPEANGRLVKLLDALIRSLTT